MADDQSRQLRDELERVQVELRALKQRLEVSEADLGTEVAAAVAALQAELTHLEPRRAALRAREVLEQGESLARQLDQAARHQAALWKSTLRLISAVSLAVAAGLAGARLGAPGFTWAMSVGASLAIAGLMGAIAHGVGRRLRPAAPATSSPVDPEAEALRVEQARRAALQRNVVR